MNIISIDYASEVSAVAIISHAGRVKRQERVVSTVPELCRIIKGVARPRQVVFEEGPHAAWLSGVLARWCDDVLVCDPRQLSELARRQKTDRKDASDQGLWAHAGLLRRIWHGGTGVQSLREAVRMYIALTRESTRLKNGIKGVFRSCGKRVKNEAYHTESRKIALKKLRLEVQRERVSRLGTVLDVVTQERAAAFKTMVKYARQNSLYKPLRLVDGVGPTYAAMLASEIGAPQRFRTRRQFWSYAGLAILSFETSEYEVRHGKIVRKDRPTRTRGLVRSYNRILKCVCKQAAMTLSRTKWEAYYQGLLKRSKNPANAQLTMARKFAAVVLHVAKTGERYDVTKVLGNIQ